MLGKFVLLAFLAATPLVAADADASGSSPDPGQLLDKMAARYAGCVSMRLDGEVANDDETLLELVGRYVTRGRMQPFFTMEFSRHGHSRFVFTDPDGTRLETRGGEEGAVCVDSRVSEAHRVASWSDGLHVLEAPTSGAASILRELLFGLRSENSVLSLSDLRFGGVVKIGRVPAWLIHGRSPKYAMTLWIARNDARLLRVERTSIGASPAAVTIDFIERAFE